MVEWWCAVCWFRFLPGLLRRVHCVLCVYVTMCANRTGPPNSASSAGNSQIPVTQEENWLLCGQINLHKSPVCAAQLVTYINYSMSQAKLDKNGYINASYLPSVRTPWTVTEWKDKNTSRIADLQVTAAGTTGAGANWCRRHLAPASPGAGTTGAGANWCRHHLAPASPGAGATAGDGEDAGGDSGSVGSGASAGSFQRRLDSFLRQCRRGEKQVGNQTCAGASSAKAKEDGRLPSGFIFALQEVHTYKDKITNVADTMCIFDKTAQKVRAALILSKTVNAWPIEEFVTPDMATAHVNLSSGEVLYIVSLYADCTKAPVPRILRSLVNKAAKDKAEVIIMCDTNAHSEGLWSDKRTCPRGEAWENFVTDKRLIVHNQGDVFTFNTRRGQSIIDVTFSTAGIASAIKAWQAVDAVPSSDHVSIQFALQIGCQTMERRRNFRKCNWKYFQDQLEIRRSPLEQQDEWTAEDLEAEASNFLADIQEVAAEACPLSKVATGPRKIQWWGDSECKRLNIRMHSIRKYLRWHSKYNGTNRAKYTDNDLTDCRKAFKAACRRAKRRSWRSFVEDVDSNPQVARLNQVFNKKVNQDIGLLHHPEGRLCTPKESMALLCSTHFPKCLMSPPIRPRRPLVSSCKLDDPKADFINEHRVEIVAKSFGSFKGPGPDALPPCVYQNFGPVALVRLVRIYKASYLLGYMPESWRQIKVIFIPKPDKPSYSIPKAFRPISLMSFMMKICEKLLLWEFEDRYLSVHPLENEQHGFRKSRSCDSCLSTMYEEVEHALIKKQFAVAVYLDIEGCYDNLQNISMSQALRSRGAPEEYVRWYEDFFYYRQIHLKHKGVELEAYPTQGAPQGGVGSPMLWSLLSDELIKKVKSVGGVFIQCYADDSSIFSTGACASACVERVQKGVDAAIQWGRENLLRFSPSKTEAMLFTRRRKKPQISRLEIEGNPIEYMGLCRHLGLWVDSQLRWGKHLDIKAAAVRKLLHKHLAAAGRLWGYKPIIAMYVWRGIARPKLTYACLIWNSILRLKSRVDQLRRLQSLSFKLMAFYRRKAPVKGLELITHTLPLEFFIMRTAAKAFFRTIPYSNYSDEDMHTTTVSDVGHRQWVSRMLQDNDLEWLRDPSDEAPLLRKWSRVFNVDLKSMEGSNPKRGSPLGTNQIEIYTDGSKLDDDACGAGMAVLMDGQIVSEGSWYLGTIPSVFQSELYGLKQAAIWILRNVQRINSSVSVYSDNQASLFAINNTFIKSELVQETISLLEEAALAIRTVDDEFTVNIHWIKSHIGHKGNEAADELAKGGAGSGQLVLDPPKMPKALLHRELDKLSYKMWAADWVSDPTCRQTKHWFPEGPIPSFSYSLLNQPRIIFGQLVGLVTGHNHLKRHQALVDASLARQMGMDEDDDFVTPDKWCDLCGGGEQTTDHILSGCDALASLRLDAFGTEEPQKPYSQLKLSSLISFLRETRLTNLEMYHNFQQFLDVNNNDSQCESGLDD